MRQTFAKYKKGRKIHFAGKKRAGAKDFAKKAKDERICPEEKRKAEGTYFAGEKNRKNFVRNSCVIL